MTELLAKEKFEKEQPRKRRKKPEKKVTRACNHCRKAHITCDDSRPCKRCVSKGLGDTCADAPRKAKKYLIADGTESSDYPSPDSVITNSAVNATTGGMATGFVKPDIKHTPEEVKTPDKNFLSSAANLEYSVLGNIIDQDVLTDSSRKFLSPPLSNASDDLEYLNFQPLMALQKHQHQKNQIRSSVESQLHSLPVINKYNGLYPGYSGNSNINDTMNGNHNGVNDGNQNLNHSQSNNHIDYKTLKFDEKPKEKLRKIQYSDLYPVAPHCDANTNQYFIGSMATIDGIKTYTFPDIVKQISSFKNEHPAEFRERNKKSAISFSIGVLDDVPSELLDSTLRKDSQRESPRDEESSNSSNTNAGNDDNNNNNNNNKNALVSIGGNKCGLLFHEPSEIYGKVKSPFPYVKPYHELNIYLKNRFDKKDLLQMSRSMAEYRPSFIAGMIKLKEDDLIFAEQCFQRTLLEYDGYIGINGTPTLVWRRTSQIAYVGDEFCVLTGWSKDELLGKSTFAVEIMDDKSCVEYFKLFSKIAFGDFRGATMTECTLLTPKGESIRTSSIWTLKRDVFGIPMMIIANFLPILT